MPSEARLERVEVAFNAGGQWDSNWNANYMVEAWEFSNGAEYVSYAWSPDISVACWDFIVEQMRK